MSYNLKLFFHVNPLFHPEIRFQCMGTWRDESGNVFAAMANTGKDVWRERYRCLVSVSYVLSP